MQALGDQDDRPARRDLGFEAVDQHLFADAIDGVDRVPFVVAIVNHSCECFVLRLVARPDHGVADTLVQLTDRLEQQLDIS